MGREKWGVEEWREGAGGEPAGRGCRQKEGVFGVETGRRMRKIRGKRRGGRGGTGFERRKGEKECG